MGNRGSRDAINVVPFQGGNLESSFATIENVNNDDSEKKSGNSIDLMFFW